MGKTYMERFIRAIAWLMQAGRRVQAKKWSFFGLSALVFAATVLALAQLDLLPDPASAASAAPAISLSASPLVAAEGTVPAGISSAELPVKIAIPEIQLSATIANPDTTDVTALDNLLLKGAVRYPTSAKLGETGNVVLFGHSSYLPVVLNQAYKTFDGIQKLAAGDVITVYSSDTAYTYEVRSVAKESANDAAIPLSVSGRVLTLSTCDSFGAKTDRFVVVADFVESHPLSS